MRGSNGIKPPLQTALCRTCGTAFATHWRRQVYCSPCGKAARDGAARRTVLSRRLSKSDALRQIASASSAGKRDIGRLFEAPQFEWVIGYRVNFSLDASKNRRWSNNGQGTVFLSKAVRNYQDYIIHATKRALAGQPIKTNKLWLSFFVQKPNHRSDAINVVDTLCDAIKVATGLDDNWFCLGKVDWEVKKDDPEIFIRIAQETTEHSLVCSHCGDIKPLADFSNKKNGPHGKSRVCRSCKSILDRHTREARRFT